jgi:gliding motility-associated-like protein
MKKYLLLILLIPIFSFAQSDTVIVGNDSLIYSYSDASCYASCDGQLQVSVFGPNTPYSFIIGASNDTLVNGTILDTLCPNNYSILVLDGGNNLVDVHNVEINAPSELLIYSSLIKNPTCHNESTGLINLATFGDNPFLWSWNNGEITEDIAGLDSGMYVLTTTDGNGCSRTDTFELTNPSEVNSTTITDTLSCIGLCDGQAIVTPADGIAPYSFEWNNDNTQINDTANNLCYGVNFVVITDANGCLDTNEVFIENPDTLKLSNITIDSSCYQVCDGQLSVTIEGGAAPYLTEWSFGGSIVNLLNDTLTNNDLCPGDYQIKFTDANLCVDSVIIPLIERDSFLVQPWVIDDSCYNSCTGQITVQLLNPVSLPIIYSWDNGGADTVISNLCSDTFELIVIDSRLCSDTVAFFVEPGDSMYFDSVAVTHNNCYGDEDGVISLINFNGGVQPLYYLWSNSETSSGINSLLSGFYNVTITDANGCSLDSSNIEVSQPDSLFATPSSEDVSCFGGSDGLIDIDLFGGVVPYFISVNSVIADTNYLDSLSAGAYFYNVVDSNNCEISDTIFINEPDELIISDSLIDVLCKGESTGEIHITVTGGTAPYEYSLNGGAFQSQAYFDNLSADPYSIIVKDANDCLLNSPLYNISEPLTVLSTGLTPLNLLCFGDTGTVVLTVSGGTPPYTYDWGNGVTTQNLIGAGSGYYEVTIFDANDCELVENINVSSPDEIIVSEVITDLSCFEDGTGEIDISITGGVTSYVLLWSNGETTSYINGLDADTYTLNLTDDNGCTDSYNFDVEQPDLLELTSIVSHVACFGESNGEIDITVTGGTTPYNFDWSSLTSNEDLQNVPVGSYDITVTDANNCLIPLTTIAVNEPTEITYAITLTDLVCNNVDEGEILITATGGTPGYSYSIDGGTSYQSGNNFTDLQADNYSVWIQDANGCEKHEVAVLNQPIGYSTSVIITDVEGCNGESTGSIEFTIIDGNTPPYTYSWDTYPAESTQDISSLVAGTYIVTVNDVNNCEMMYSYQVIEPDSLELAYTIINPTSCEEGGAITTVVTGGTPPYSYLWGNEETSSDLFNPEEGINTLYLEDSKGCSLPTKRIDVGFEELNGCIEIPSGFTPNGDGIHDEWIITTHSQKLKDRLFVSVYNRWGQELFSSSGYPVPWDGKYNGVDLPTATYYYVIELNESDKVFNGTVTIKR